jgi:uncharacterized membrane protein
MAAALYMDAVIRPNRSMPMVGLKVLLGVMVAWSVLISIFVFAVGGWFAPAFLGVDILGVWLAFKASYRAQERRERVRVTAEQITVAHELDGTTKTVWTSPTAFTAVDVDHPHELDTRVRLRLSGRRCTVARTLSPEEREGFADALREAIRAARSERYSP